MSTYLPKSRPLLLFIMLVAISQVGCSTLMMSFLGGPSLTDLQSKYWTVDRTSSGDYCVPYGANKKYHDEPYSCFGNSEQCPLYEEAFNGQLPQDATEMFLDATILRDEDPVRIGLFGEDRYWVGNTFAMSCKYSAETRRNLYATAFRGLGYAGHEEGGDLMANVVAKGQKLNQDQFMDLTLATFHTGNHSAFEELFEHLTTHESSNLGYAPIATVELMGFLGLDSAKAYCDNELGEANDQRRVNACIRYLTSIDATDSTDRIYRHLQDSTDHVVRALGQLEYEPAKDRIIALADEGNFAAIVAAINLGESSYWETLQRRIQGFRNESDRERVAERGDRFLDRRGARFAILESALIKNEEISEALMTELASITDRADAEDELVWAHAQIVIAQRGGPIDGVVSALNSPNSDVREFTVSSLAVANPIQGNPGPDIRYHGTQMVRDADLIPELLNFFQNESDSRLQYAALFAAASIRSLKQ